MLSYTIASPLAMAASAISGTLSILLLIEPAFHDGLTIRLIVPVAVSIGLVTMAIITGVLAHGARDLASRCALAALAACLSLGIVWEQYGRRAQSLNTVQSVAVDSARERARLTKLRAEADEILTTHRAAQAKECASGKGKRCDGISYTVRTWEAAVAGYDAKLAAPAAAPNAKTENVGIIARMLGYSADNAKTWVAILDPVAVPMLLELAAILCGIVAWGPAVAGNASVAPVSRPVSPVSTPETRQNQAFSEGPNPTEDTAKTAHASPLRVETDESRVIRALKKKGGQVGSQDELGLIIGVSKGEVSKMLRNCANVERIRVDNKNVIRIRDVG